VCATALDPSIWSQIGVEVVGVGFGLFLWVVKDASLFHAGEVFTGRVEKMIREGYRLQCSDEDGGFFRNFYF